MTDTERITLRMPKPVHDWLRLQSFETRESINALIVKALEEKMNQPNGAKENKMNENTQFVHISKNDGRGNTVEDAYIVDGKEVSYQRWLSLTDKAKNQLGLAWAKRVNMVQYNIGPTDHMEAHVNKYIS